MDSFPNVEIYAGKTIGAGAYGNVCRAVCGQLPCAAKLLHEAIMQSDDPGVQSFAERFKQECQFLSVIKHPNIVQYLGTTTCPKSGRLVLLMELMDENLTKFLERSTDPLPYYKQVNICHDVALALAYLHSKAIIHRDLSGNNVLLIGAGIRAKVTDFGMSKLIKCRPKHLTECPGNSVYMPPEALIRPPSYSSKLDCFSMGVLAIQIITRKFPDPGGPHGKDPNDPTGRVIIQIPELDRRKEHIALIEPDHPLLPIALQCIKDRERERPSADEFCEQLSSLKEKAKYAHSKDQSNLLVQKLQLEVETKDQEIQLRDKALEIKTEEHQRELEGTLVVSQKKAEEYQRELMAKEQVIQRLQNKEKVLRKKIQYQSHLPFFGKRKSDYKVLLLGETGSGKTSFLNLICNYAHLQKLGHHFNKDGFEKLQQFNDPELEKGCKMGSKTSETRLYEVDELGLWVIDTPGLGDFGGDEENLKKIISCIEEEEYINCICIVINGRQTRITANMKYALTEIASILPIPVLGQVLFVFTNVADPLDLYFDPNEFKTYFGKKVDITAYTCIDNPYSRFERAIEMEKEGKIEREYIVQSLRKLFDDTREVLKKMCRMMKKFGKVHAQQFVQLCKKRQAIEGRAFELFSAYDYQKKLEKEITSAQEDVEASLREKQLNPEFYFMKQILKAEATDTAPVHNLLCTIPDCYSNCHLQCQPSMSFHDETVLKNSICFDNGKHEDCRECGHSYRHHYHAYRKWEKKIIEVNLVNDEMRKEIEEATSMKDRAKALKKGLEKQLKDSEAKRQKLSAQLLEKIEEFEGSSVGRNYAKLIESQIEVIKLRIADSTTEPELQNVKEQLDRKLEVVCKTLGK